MAVISALTPQARELLARVAPSLAEMKGCWRTARSSRIRPLCPSPAPKPCWRATSPASCTPIWNGIPHCPLYPPHPGHSGPGARRDALLGICAGRLPPGHGLCAERLLEEPFYLVGEALDEAAQPDHQGALQETVTSKQLAEGDVSQGMQGKVQKILTMDLENPSNRYLREPLAALGLIPAMELDSTWR